MTSGLFPFFTIKNRAAMNIHVEVFVWMDVFPSLGSIPRSEIARLFGNSMFNFSKNCQTVFHRHCHSIKLSLHRWGNGAEDRC